MLGSRGGVSVGLTFGRVLYTSLDGFQCPIISTSNLSPDRPEKTQYFKGETVCLRTGHTVFSDARELFELRGTTLWKEGPFHLEPLVCLIRVRERHGFCRHAEPVGKLELTSKEASYQNWSSPTKLSRWYRTPKYTFSAESSPLRSSITRTTSRTH